MASVLQNLLLPAAVLRLNQYSASQSTSNHGPRISLDLGMHSRVDTCLVETTFNRNRPLRSGDLSQAAGVSTDTLRHYERLGILKKPPRTLSGYRMYPPESLERVLLIRNSLAAGFTLKEITEILRVRDLGGVPCQKVIELAHQKMSQLDQ